MTGTVLIVEDEPDIMGLMKIVLESENLTTLSAFDGQEAIKVLESNIDINLVLMNGLMPKMSGIGAIKEIRKNEKYKDIPVIIHSTMKHLCLKGMIIGANDYILQPFSNKELLDKVNSNLTLK